MLKLQLKKYDIVDIFRWAYKIYFDNIQNLDDSTTEILVFILHGSDPQFEYTEKELKLLAEKLINNEENPIQQINEMKSKGLKIS